MTDFVHRETVVNGLRFHYVEAGEGPLVVLLHGFPEFWYSWRYQIPVLAEAGFHVLAPDLRGYNKSDKPVGKNQYHLNLIADDVAGLIRAMGEDKAIVVGHDWGGAIAWKFACAYSEMVARLIILNAPHPAAFKRELRTFSQLSKSWYMFFFQLPYIPEAGFRAWNYAALEHSLRQEPVRRDAFTPEDIAIYKAAMSEPGALTAAINYYRANLRYLWGDSSWFTDTITRPTLIIWGEHDRYLSISLLNGLDQWVSDLRIERIPHGSHWIQVDAYERVNELIIDFLSLFQSVAQSARQ